MNVTVMKKTNRARRKFSRPVIVRTNKSLTKACKFMTSDISLTVGAAMSAILALLIMFGPYLAAHNPQVMSQAILAGPSYDHWLGTDSVGRDVLARLVVGMRSSLFISIAATSGALVIGVAVGVSAAYFGGMVDWIEMRIVDILLSVPTLLVAITVLAAIGPSVSTLLAVLMLTYVPQCVRVVRASSLQIAERAYVESARISGLGPIAIMWKHILPNIRGILIVQTTIMIAQMLLIETALSFLGLGVPPPTPNLGFMLAEGRQWMELAPWVVLAPGCVIAFSVAAFTFIGHGLDRALVKQT